MKKHQRVRRNFMEHFDTLDEKVGHSIIDFVQKMGFHYSELSSIDIYCISKDFYDKKAFLQRCIVVFPVKNVNVFIPCMFKNIASFRIGLYKFEEDVVYDLKFVLFCLFASRFVAYSITYDKKPIITPIIWLGTKTNIEEPLHPPMEFFLYALTCYVSRESEDLGAAFSPFCTNVETGQDRYTRLLKDENRLFTLGSRIEEIRRAYTPRTIYFKDLVKSNRYLKNKSQIGDFMDQLYMVV